MSFRYQTGKQLNKSLTMKVFEKQHLTIKNCDKTFRKGILKICRQRFDVWLTSLSSQKVKDKKSLNTKRQ